jgi:pyrroloquinoline quinone biosynthesis protein E
MNKDRQQSHSALDNWLLSLPAPEPSLGLKAYKRERWIALVTSPRRLWNYYKYTRSSRRGSVVTYHPIKLDIENVSRCNFRCTMCQVSGWPKLKRADDMAFEDFKQLIDHQFGLVEIKLQGMGEPTLGGETFFNMIRYARKKHIWVRTVTNASMLHLRDNYRKLVDSGVNEVQISIDGATKEAFEKIRVGSNFEVVMANCKLINSYCAQVRRPITKMWTVVQRGNFHELPQLIELACELGFKSMVFSLNLTDWGQEKWTERNREATVDKSLTREIADSLMRRAKELEVVLSWWNVTTKYSTASREKLCPWPFERAYVSSDMRVVPCCMIANPEAADLGDARRFTQVWTGEQYKKFREEHLSGNIPKVCQMCYILPGKQMDGPTEVASESIPLRPVQR